jgi:hypothetical protein
VGFVLQYLIFSFMCMFCRSLFVLVYFFFLAIVLSVLLRYTDSDYPFGIFKLFLIIILFYFIFSYYAAPPDESNPHVYDGISPIYDLPDEDDHHEYEKANSNITDVHGYECLNHHTDAISS